MSRSRASDTPTTRTCATDMVHERLLREVPGYAERRAESENHAWRAARMGVAGRQGCTTIPVVVHVVYRTDAENISEAQIKSQIDVLNADFRRTNADVNNAPAPFKPLATDSRINFELAKVDPDGNPTDGITRRKTTVNGFTHDDAVKANSSGGTDAWPRDEYLNLWVCRLAGGLLGYAQFPGGPSATDGVVVTHTAFGTTGTAAPPFNKGRTATHEIGHWLNLRHIWGDDGTGCSGSDFVDDTPNQGGPNVGTPAFPRVTCNNGPNGDMFMNYMDYVDDEAMFMFSAGQVMRMQATLDGLRSSIGTTGPCVKLKFLDEPLTLKFRDDPNTLKFLDDPVAKPILDPTTLKFRDDPITIKFLDDGGTDPRADLGTYAVSDKPPVADNPVFDPQGPVVLWQGQPSPFVLSTPHHSMAWAGGQSGGQADALQAYEERLQQYEQALRDYAQAEADGTLDEAGTAEMHEVYAEYLRLGEEYRQRGGGR